MSTLSVKSKKIGRHQVFAYCDGRRAQSYHYAPPAQWEFEQKCRPVNQPQESFRTKKTLKERNAQWILTIEKQLEQSPGAAIPELIKLLGLKKNQELVAYAAQRLRVVPLSTEQRSEAWYILHRWIEKWSDDPSCQHYLNISLPSAIPLGRSAAVDFVRGSIQTAEIDVAESLALGLFTGSPKAGSLLGILPESEVTTLFLSILNRLASRSRPMPNLVWAIGPTTGKRSLRDAVSMLENIFTRPKGFEDAAAIRAGCMLTRAWGPETVKLIKDIFGDDTGSRYLAYLVRHGR